MVYHKWDDPPSKQLGCLGVQSFLRPILAPVSPCFHRFFRAKNTNCQLPSDDRSPGVSGVQSFQDVTAAVDVVLVDSRDKDGCIPNVRVLMV